MKTSSSLGEHARGNVSSISTGLPTAKLASVFNAHKMNYEFLGNQIAHIHWHLIPRLANDPRRAEPVWRQDHGALALPEPERSERIARIRAALER